MSKTQIDLSEMPIADLVAALDSYPHEIRGGCKIWLGPKRPTGYGLTRVAGKVVSVHRIAYFLANGKIPMGADICHRCDTPSCFAEDHLFAGTRSENMLDASKKKRLRCQSDPSVMLRGTAHPRAKLTEDQISEIIFSTESNGQLAKRLNYHVGNIAKIRDGRLWKDTVARIRALKTAPTISPRDTLIEEIAEMVDHMGEGRRLEEYVGAIREMKSGDKGGA
ncbi:HNH endonuclease signature motif containing protein [Burkholderia vietnamiensis]